MSNKNAIRTTLAGLGVAGGAILAAAAIPAATASADDDIDGHSGTFSSNITTSDSGPAVDIFNNTGHIYTNIYGTVPDTYDDVTIENNRFGGPITTNIYGTGTGAQNVVDIAHNGANVDTALVGGDGPGNENLVDIDSNTGQIITLITDKATDAAPVSVTISDNSGSADVTQLTDASGGDITLSGNTDQQTVDLMGNSGSYTIAIDSGSGQVSINDGSDLAPVFVGVDVTHTGEVLAHVDGVFTVVPAGDEYEFVNGAVDVISTTF